MLIRCNSRLVVAAELVVLLCASTQLHTCVLLLHLPVVCCGSYSGCQCLLLCIHIVHRTYSIAHHTDMGSHCAHIRLLSARARFGSLSTISLSLALLYCGVPLLACLFLMCTIWELVAGNGHYNDTKRNEWKSPVCRCQSRHGGCAL